MTREEAELHLMDIISDWNNPNTDVEVIESLDIALCSLKAWDAVLAEIHRMEFIYDTSPLLNDKRTDAQKASDWWGMERLIVLGIIDKHLQEVENG